MLKSGGVCAETFENRPMTRVRFSAKAEIIGLMIFMGDCFAFLFDGHVYSEGSFLRKANYQVCLVERIWDSWFVTSLVPPSRNIAKILGERIRAERIKAGMSQEQLAEKADLARNYIGNIERAEYKITVETLSRLAKALNLTVHDLTEGF